jgi:hypothetical protein
MALIDTQEVLDKLASYGEDDGNTQKQMYRSNLNGFTCLVQHPTTTTHDDEGNDIPKVVELPAQNIDSYIAKGFTVVPPEDEGVLAKLKAGDEDADAKAKGDLDLRGTDELDGMTVADLKELAEDEEVDLGGASLKADIIAAIREDRGSRV